MAVGIVATMISGIIIPCSDLKSRCADALRMFLMSVRK